MGIDCSNPVNPVYSILVFLGVLGALGGSIIVCFSWRSWRPFDKLRTGLAACSGS
jgi:hypothetical protein